MAEECECICVYRKVVTLSTTGLGKFCLIFGWPEGGSVFTVRNDIAPEIEKRFKTVGKLFIVLDGRI